MKFGLLGKKLGHSFSKQIHQQIADYSYDLYEKEIDQIEDFVKSDIDGFNITNPYKIEIIKYIDKISPRAKAIGSVNTLIKRNGQIIGDNTDYFGFEYIIDSLNENFKKAIILGDGATSKTVAAVLKDRDIEFVKLSRKTPPLYSDLSKYKDIELLINATPVGMYPNNGDSLINLDKMDKLKAVVDVIYNPYITDLLFQARDKKIKYSNGLKMLVAQAVEASRIFQDKDIDYEIIDRIEKKILEDRNIVIIGMPGAGKTSVAKTISRKTNKKFVDLDKEIEKYTNKSISQIFKDHGESYFRKLESQMLREFSKKNNQVIATGGGIVKDKNNYRPLKQNSVIYFIKRDIEKLDKKNRPLSKDINTLKKLWQERKDSYYYFADKKVENINIEETANQIIGDFYENTSY